MKNWIQKLTVGVLFLTLLILGSSKIARATSIYDQPDGSVEGFNDGGSETSYVYLTGFSGFTINSVSISTQGNCMSGQPYTTVQGVLYDSAFSTVLGTQTISNPITTPDPGIVTFTFSPPVAGFTDGYFYWAYTGGSCSSGSHQFRINGSGVSGWTYGSRANNGFSESPLMIFNGVPPPNITITSPPANSVLGTATTTTFSGTCITNGTGQLELTYSPFLARLDDSSKYNIDCVSGSWSAARVPQPGQNTIWIVDKSAIGENPPNIFNTQRYASLQYIGNDSNQIFAINLITPQLPNDHWLYLAPDPIYVFRFSVQQPPYTVDSDLIMGFQQFNDLARTSASTTTEFIGLQSITTNNFIEHHYDIDASSTPSYYRVYLKYQTNVVAFLDFNVLATTDRSLYNIQQTILPNGQVQDLGFWGNTVRFLLVPDSQKISPLLTAVESDMAQNLPFSYFFQAKNILDTQVISTSTPSAIEMVIPAGDFGAATTTVDVPFLGTVDTDPVRAFANQIRGYLTAGLWLLFTSYALYRFTDTLTT